MAAVCSVLSVPACIPGSGTPQARPSPETATPGKWGHGVVWGGGSGLPVDCGRAAGQRGQRPVKWDLAWVEKRLRWGWFGEVSDGE